VGEYGPIQSKNRWYCVIRRPVVRFNGLLLLMSCNMKASKGVAMERSD
jgi:hypothetical protein